MLFAEVLVLVFSKLYLVLPNSASLFSVTVFLCLKKRKIKSDQVYSVITFVLGK